MAKNRLFGCFLLIIAMLAACTPIGSPSMQAPEITDPLMGAQQTIAAATQGTMDPVVGAQQTLDAATQQSVKAVEFARQTLAAADAEIAFHPDLPPSEILSRPNDETIQAVFTGQVICSQFEIHITNRGPTVFKSVFISISIKDDPSSIAVTSFTNGFLGYSLSQTDMGENCDSLSTSTSLDPGTSHTVFFPKFIEKGSNTFEGSIMLCSENDLGGECSKNTIVFASTDVPEVNTEIILSPAPSPLAPDFFTAEYVNTIHPCAKSWWVTIHLTNKFSRTFKSMSISVKDTATGEVTAETDEHQVFVDLDRNICDPDIEVGNDTLLDDLAPNQSFTVSSGVFREDLTNHPMEATLKLCTEEDLSGECSTKTINFTPGLTVQPTVDTTKPDYPYVILSEGTNCRTGPGQRYDLVGAYAKDTKIPVLGKDAAGEYWVVASPHRGDTNIKCWLDGRWVKEKGNVEKVEIFLPPPTPTSSPKPPTSIPTQTPTATATLTSTP